MSGVKFCWFVRGAKDICLWTGGSHDPNRSKKVLNLMGLLLGACFVFLSENTLCSVRYPKADTCTKVFRYVSKSTLFFFSFEFYFVLH